MLINAVNRANPAQRIELQRWMEAKSFDRQEKVSADTRLYDEIGIRQLCEQKINHYFDLARQTLNEVLVADERKQALRLYMDDMLHRNK
jgi:geranylgeranyl diphosphate synthase type II